MESYGELRRPTYKTVDHFISQQTAPDWANKKLENRKWEQLSEDAKHYMDAMRGHTKNVIQRRKLQDKILLELIFLFQEYPELHKPSHWDPIFKKAKNYFFTKTREDLEKNPNTAQMNQETLEFLKANLPSIEEETEDSDV